MKLEAKINKENKSSDFEELFDEVRSIYESSRNIENINYWQTDTKAHWRGTPPKKRGELPVAPFSIELEPPLWGLILDFNVKQYFTDPKIYLEAELKKAIFKFKNFNDCSSVGKIIPLWLGVPFETTLYGLPAEYSDFDSPWIGKTPVIKDENDLNKLPPVNFYKSGLMPLAHRFYNEIKDMIPDDFTVYFTEWEKSIFSVLWHTRGLESLLMDIYDKPDFIRKLFMRITDDRKKWFEDRAKFLKNKVEPGNILNDEVGSPVISPENYKEFILPSEIELGNFHGGISYWHSCGNTTKFLKHIRKIPGLKLFHVSDRTDLKTAVKEMGENDIALQICLHPVKDLQMATKIEMKKKLEEIAEICGDIAYTVRVDGIQKLHSVDIEIQKIKEWIDIAREVLS